MSCSNPQTGSDVSAYIPTSGSSCEDTIYTYFKGGTATPRANMYARMVDYMWGAASYFKIPVMMALGIPIQEGGAGPSGTPPYGNDWCNVLQGGGASQLETFMSDYNVTGVSFDDTSIDACDAINAAAAMCYTQALYTYYAKSYSGNDLLRAVLNGYTAGETGATHPLEGGYGYSVLFKAYGNTWSSADGTGYSGAYMATGPSGTQYEVGYGSVSTSIPTPDFAVSAGTHDVPWGSDSSTVDRRILLFVTEDTAYASGIIICQNFVQASPSRTAFPMVLTDVAFAANSANCERPRKREPVRLRKREPPRR